jgi:hypothetical protein
VVAGSDVGTGIFPQKLVTAAHGDGVWKGFLRMEAGRKTVLWAAGAAGAGLLAEEYRKNES